MTKRKIKKTNFTIFIIFLIMLVVSITFSLKKLNNTKTKNTTKVENKVLSEKENKLNKLNNIDHKLDYFNYDYLDRYLAYKEKNPTLTNEKIVIYVNMGLDNKYYTNTKKTKDLNKDYILVNKYNYLTEDYIPANLENISLEYGRSGMKLISHAKLAFEKMAADAKKENMTILATSSYRSYEYQVNLYNKYEQTDGKIAADTYSARPGFSEHQTGLAVDVHNDEKTFTEFESTKEFTWMQNNAYKYGFILRFPKDKVNETGYTYEAWHYRYVGKKIAEYIQKHQISFEEYYVKFIENKM